jgi:hypothetical protein
MGRIQDYAIDAKPELSDKVIGTDSGVKKQTKNYTLGEISDLINQTNSLAVADQSIFEFQYDLTRGRNRGTISFAAGGGVDTNFADITTIILSKYGAGGKDIGNFLPLFSGKDVIIAESGTINQFGSYRVTSIVDYPSDTDFLEVSLTLYSGNGKIRADKYYIFSEFVNPAATNGDKNFVFTQAVASATWNVNHNLDKFPSCTMVLSTGQQGFGDVTFIDENNLTITFAGPESGKAYIN